MDKEQELRFLKTLDITNSLLRQALQCLQTSNQAVTDLHKQVKNCDPVVHVKISKQDIEDNEHHFAPVHGWD